MKTIFDKTTRDEVIKRINSINENSKALWGKMNAGQMLQHCIRWEEMILQKIVCKQVFFGRLFGKLILKRVLKDESFLGRNTPTSPELKISRINVDIATERTKLISLIQGHLNFSNPDFIHPFFGKMTKDQIGYLAYKHIDHHLRQFNS